MLVDDNVDDKQACQASKCSPFFSPAHALASCLATQARSGLERQLLILEHFGKKVTEACAMV